MTLEQRYAAAASNTNAGRAKANTDVVQNRSGPGVNFMDAGARIGITDTLQSNFQQEKTNTTEFVQGTDTTIAAGERKGLSRWYGRALNYAFTDPNATASSIKDSVWKTYKGMRTLTRDSWTDNSTNFHRWTPTVKFAISDTLSSFAKIRATPKSVPTSTP
jgi:hypothetical protein